MDLTRRLVLLDDTAAALRMVRAELATVEIEERVQDLGVAHRAPTAHSPPLQEKPQVA
jgi:hypothetical protein